MFAGTEEPVPPLLVISRLYGELVNHEISETDAAAAEISE
jgi:hypothetical protein